jgi:Tol biopolymer transport system component
VLVFGSHATVGSGFLRVTKTGTAPVKVTGTPGLVYQFRVSPDRKTVAYSDASTGIFSTLSLAGGTPVRLALSSYRASGFAWRPDGSAIAFVASQSSYFGTTQAMYLVPYPTTDYPTLLTLANLVSSGTYSPPVWAPDGSTFAINGPSSSAAGSKNEVLRLDNVTSANQTWRVLHTTTNASLYVNGLTWTP